MNSVNWFLVAVSFALGLVLTGAFVIGRAKREVPVYATGGAKAATLTGSAAAPKAAPAEAAPAKAEVEPDDEKAELPPGPHGPGTAAPNADGSGPRGWDVKGNEDSMLYHSTESPYYGRTIAEVWFRDVESAEAAGFNRWDSGKSQRDKK